MEAVLVPAGGARGKELLEVGLDHVRCLEVAFSQMTSQLPEQPIFVKCKTRATSVVKEDDLSKHRELGHRCACVMGAGVIVLEPNFFHCERESIDSSFQVS